MSATDAAFLEMETATMHLHVVGVVVLDPSAIPGGMTLERIATLFDERIHLIPPFRRRVVTVPATLDHPRWVEDQDFDLAGHLHHENLGPGARSVDLARFVGRLASSPLDRRRPLWETWLVDGMADGTVAMVTKVHHSIMDGAAGGDMMASLFDLAPDTDRTPRAPRRDVEAIPEPWRLIFEAGCEAVNRAAALPGVVGRTVSGLGASARALASRPAVRFAPASPFNGRLTETRSVAFARCPLRDLREIRRCFDTTINDVVLAATTISVRNYLLARGIEPRRPFVASVPVALSHVPDGPALGNRTSNIMVSLPVHLEDPVRILHDIHTDALGAKAVHRSLGPDVVEDWVGLAPAGLLTTAARMYSELGLGRFHPPLFNLIVSNVVGPPIPLYLAGARIVATYPMGPLIGNTGLNLTVFSQDGDLDVGVIACPALVDDVEAIADGFVDGVSRLVELAGTHTDSSDSTHPTAPI